MNEGEFLKARTERSGKATLGAIFGAVLLVAGVCIGVWAFANYLDSKTYFYDVPDAPNTQGETASLNKPRHRGTWDEAVLGGAASLIFLSGAGFSLVRAAKIHRRIKRGECEEID